MMLNLLLKRKQSFLLSLSQNNNKGRIALGANNLQFRLKHTKSFAPKVFKEYQKQIDGSDYNCISLSMKKQEASANNLENAIGIPAEYIIWCEHTGKFQDDLSTWNDITKGSDMFIPGLGNFDIIDTYNKIILERHREWIIEGLKSVRKKCLVSACKVTTNRRTKADVVEHLSSDASFEFITFIQKAISDREILSSKRIIDVESHMKLAWWVVSVQDIQVAAYFNDVVDRLKYWHGGPRCLLSLKKILRQDDICPVRQHLIKYYTYWSDPRYLGKLDSMLRHGQFPENMDETNPEIGKNNLFCKMGHTKSIAPKVLKEYQKQIDGSDYNCISLSMKKQEASANNLENVIGIPVEYIKWCEHTENFQGDLSSWNDITRGSDMFIPGLGNFDIIDTYNKIILERRHEWVGEGLMLVRAQYLIAACKVMTNERTKANAVEHLASDTSFELVSFIQKAISDREILSSKRIIDVESHMKWYRFQKYK